MSPLLFELIQFVAQIRELWTGAGGACHRLPRKTVLSKR
jgi:hypothetical protein